MLDSESLQHHLPIWSRAIAAKLMYHLHHADPVTLAWAMQRFPEELEIQLALFVEKLEKDGVFDPAPDSPPADTTSAAPSAPAEQYPDAPDM